MILQWEFFLYEKNYKQTDRTPLYFSGIFSFYSFLSESKILLPLYQVVLKIMKYIALSHPEPLNYKLPNQFWLDK